VDFRNTVIVMTSNLGSDRIQEWAGGDYLQLKQQVMGIIGDYFRPEFINRVDDCVVFHALGEEHIKRIAAIQVDLVAKRLKDNDYELVLDDEALSMLAKTGFDPVFGARPLKRAIQSELENRLAEAILSGSIQPGAIIRVSVQDGELGIVAE
jgi:ATP-dependent Clp protease ATP-binding subunit ClpB